MKSSFRLTHWSFCSLVALLAAASLGCSKQEQTDAEKPVVVTVLSGEAVGAMAPSGDTPAPATDHKEAPIAGEVASNHNVTGSKYPPVFEGWKKPLLAFYFTGRQHGYIEPCGCTGLANQKGGLSRRHVLLEKLQKDGWNPLPIDLGNQVRRFGRQADIKFQTTIDGLKKIEYQAIGLGPDDLLVSGNELLSAHIGTDGSPAPFVCANVNLLEQTKPFAVIEKAGKKIGVTGVVSKEDLRSVTSDDIEITAPGDALKKVVPDLISANCDLKVLLAQTSIEEAEALVKQYNHFDLVVVGGGVGEPANRLLPIEGSKAKLVQIGAKGMYVSVVGLFDDAENRLKLQRAPLDGRYSDSEQMLALMASYQQQLEAMGYDGLEIKPQPHPSGRTFVGSKACADCHEREYEIWAKTPHAHATDSLIHPGERSEIHRHFDPECLSCHVTGWQPQEFLPYTSGYESVEATPGMMQMGCENCHGPGSAHVAAENGEIDDLTDEMQARLQQEMVLTLGKARETCLKCHDMDNSPAFHDKGAFEEYWERVKH